jgi:poly-gamma-glutamate synthesis protein (capsule biosynthesis protein)
MIGLELLPMRIRRFQLHRATVRDAQWLCDLFAREGKRFGTRAELTAGRTIEVRWT